MGGGGWDAPTTLNLGPLTEHAVPAAPTRGSTTTASLERDGHRTLVIWVPLSAKYDTGPSGDKQLPASCFTSPESAQRGELQTNDVLNSGPTQTAARRRDVFGKGCGARQHLPCVIANAVNRPAHPLS